MPTYTPTTTTTFKCVLCDKSCTGYGNNPSPLAEGKGRCCDACNRNKVIPSRFMYAHQKELGTYECMLCKKNYSGTGIRLNVGDEEKECCDNCIAFIMKWA